MNSCLNVAILPVLTAAAIAQMPQGPSILFTTSQAEQTLSGSGGTALQLLRPNEVAQFDLLPCPSFSAEKWGPRSVYDTMAGDANADGWIHEALRFGRIDALLDMPATTAAQPPSQRSVFFSPSQAMGNFISGLPGLRPGDTARITYNTLGFGQVEHFLTAEDLQIALGLPPFPLVVDLDAIAADPSLGVFFSIDQNLPIAGACGLPFAQDGDVLMIPAWAITWTPDFRVQAVIPGSAEMCYPEFLMDAFVTAANMADATGAQVTQVGDIEGLEIDWNGMMNFVPGCTGAVSARPALVFTASTMTGCGVATTGNGGMIYGPSCGPLATPFGFGATLGNQIGLLPANAPLGVPSFVNAIATSRSVRFVLEPQQHIVPLGNPAVVDVNSPGGLNFVFAALSPNTVAPCAPFFNLAFPDVYVLGWVWSTFTPGGFSTFATPPINIPAKIVFQAATFVGPNLLISTPATVEF
jgi:hypothetical protein